MKERLKQSDEYEALETVVDKALEDLDDGVDPKEVLKKLQDTFYDNNRILRVVKRRNGHSEGT